MLDSEAPPWLSFGDRAISVHNEILRFVVFWHEKLDLRLRSASCPLPTLLSQVLWQGCPSQSASLCVFNSASWSELWGFSTALKYALTCSNFCLVRIGGRCSMNLVVSMGVTLVVHSTGRIASFCTVNRPAFAQAALCQRN